MIGPKFNFEKKETAPNKELRDEIILYFLNKLGSGSMQYTEVSEIDRNLFLEKMSKGGVSFGDQLQCMQELVEQDINAGQLYIEITEEDDDKNHMFKILSFLINGELDKKIDSDDLNGLLKANLDPKEFENNTERLINALKSEDKKAEYKIYIEKLGKIIYSKQYEVWQEFKLMAEEADGIAKLAA